MTSLNEKLLEAVRRNDFSSAEEALKQGAEACYEASYEDNSTRTVTPVMYIACENKNDRLVSLLLDWGANPNAFYQESHPWGSERKPVFFAAFPSLALTTLLLERGADPNLQSVSREDTNVYDSALSEAYHASGNDRKLLGVIKRFQQGGRRDLRIFLCHASQDKPQVRLLCDKLKDSGFDPWLDEDRLLPGQDWEREIRAEVSATDVVIVCLSKQSTGKRGFGQKEIRLALDVADEIPPGVVFLIPLRLEVCEVPPELKKWQWVNLFEPVGYARLVESLQRQETLLSESPARS